MAFTDIVFQVMQRSLGVFLRVWNRYQVRGAENIPREGGCLLASNHVSYLDPGALSCGTGKRKAWFLARNTLFGGRDWWFRAMHCIPLDRNQAEVGTIRRAVQTLKEGKLLALFPEGTRSPDGTIQKAHRGVGFIVSKAGVPVVPALIEGTYEAYPKGARWVAPKRVRITYGKPITPEEIASLGKGREGQEKIGKLIMERIGSLA